MTIDGRVKCKLLRCHFKSTMNHLQINDESFSLNVTTIHDIVDGREDIFREFLFLAWKKMGNFPNILNIFNDVCSDNHCGSS